MEHPLLLLGGTGPPVHLAPANGFPPATYLPALAPLLAGHRVVSLPPRAMWPGQGPPPETPEGWDALATDLLQGLSLHRLPPVIAIGHSFGGVASLLAAVREPDRFSGLVLLDPTIGPPDIMAALRAQQARGELGFRPLAQGARKRRRSFPDLPEAFRYWRAKPLFADWPDDAVWRYCGAMLRALPDGGYDLTWSPEWEARYYEMFYTETWDAVAKLDRALPVLVVGGETSDTFLPPARELLRTQLPRGVHHTLPGRGHLFPHSAPAETGALIKGWLATPRAPES